MAVTSRYYWGISVTFGRAFSGGAERAVAAATRNTAEWMRVLGRLKEAVGDAAFRSWFQSMRIERIDDGEGVVAVPTRFLRNWVETHYADQILILWRAENRSIARVSIIVEPGVAAAFADNDGLIAAEGQPMSVEGPVPAENGEEKALLSAPL